MKKYIFNLSKLMVLATIGFNAINTHAQTWVQKGQDIDGEAAGDESGYLVSIPDNNTIGISARMNDGSGIDAGHVRIFTWNNILNTWQQKGQDIDGEAAGDLSGTGLSMPDNNTVAIGAYFNDGNGNHSGHVRVFTWNATLNTWQQKGQDIDGEAAGDLSGNSVWMPDANTLAIGAGHNDGGGNGNDAVMYAFINGMALHGYN